MKVLDKEFSIFIEYPKIEKRIVELAEQIKADYEHKDPVFIVLLNGAFMFASDLIKNVPIPCQVSFIRVSSYQGMESTGELKEIVGLEDQITGKNIVILDDIVDTGNTMCKMITMLNQHKPLSVEVAALFLKPGAFHNKFKLKYVGFTIPNDFIVGYGLDYDGYGRNLKDIYKYKNS